MMYMVYCCTQMYSASIVCVHSVSCKRSTCPQTVVHCVYSLLSVYVVFYLYNMFVYGITSYRDTNYRNQTPRVGQHAWVMNLILVPVVGVCVEVWGLWVLVGSLFLGVSWELCQVWLNGVPCFVEHDLLESFRSWSHRMWNSGYTKVEINQPIMWLLSLTGRTRSYLMVIWGEYIYTDNFLGFNHFKNNSTTRQRATTTCGRLEFETRSG